MDGKTTTIFYNDTQNSVSKIVGKIVSQDTAFIIIASFDGRQIQLPVSKVVRIEGGQV